MQEIIRMPFPPQDTLHSKVLGIKNQLQQSDDFRAWENYFTSKFGQRKQLPWDTDYILTASEIESVAKSIQQFQLGEYARGRTFMALAYRYAERTGDSAYPRALRLFIREEQVHSAILGLFLDVSGISRLKQHWVDDTFRSARKFAGLELMIRVLVTAEMIACPYYYALRRATSSPLLQAICDKILRDETYHIYFQAQAAKKVSKGRRRPILQLINFIHLIFLYVTCAVVWRHHRGVFRKAKLSMWDMIVQAKSQFQVFKGVMSKR